MKFGVPGLSLIRMPGSEMPLLVRPVELGNPSSGGEPEVQAEYKQRRRRFQLKLNKAIECQSRKNNREPQNSLVRRRETSVVELVAHENELAPLFQVFGSDQSGSSKQLLIASYKDGVKCIHLVSSEWNA